MSEGAPALAETAGEWARGRCGRSGGFHPDGQRPALAAWAWSPDQETKASSVFKRRRGAFQVQPTVQRPGSQSSVGVEGAVRAQWCCAPGAGRGVEDPGVVTESRPVQRCCPWSGLWP